MIKPELIKTVRVHPGLGIARVGNAPDPDAYFFASEIPGMTPDPTDGSFRDDKGRLRRQAVRFRLYAELVDGTVRELTLDDGVQIEWTVELANLKAGWYQFQNAMDLGAPHALCAQRRNLHAAEREELDIRPGPRTISGRETQGDDYRFDTGTFYDQEVYLGEVRTDDRGRLIALGGYGHSAPRDPGTKPTTFANNDDWHDDVSDGPVYARLTFADGQSVDAEPGFVVVTPPNFAPGLFGVVTMADVVQDLYVRSGLLACETHCSFTRDIWPVFSRMTDLQWTNQGIYMLSGHGSPLDATSEDVLAKLTDNSAENEPFRRRVLQLFRSPQNSTESYKPALPPLYGDFYGEFDALSAAGLAVTQLMYDALVKWADGDFVSDWQGPPALPVFATLPAREQTEALDRAGLHECLGGPFHPGIELTWFMRVPSVWKSPYRLAVLPQGQAVRQDYGDELTPQACLAKDGPLDGVGPGSLTRALGVPWQTDEASCLSDGDYNPSAYLSFPSYWGARVPNSVLSTEAWERVGASQSNNAQRFKNFSYREDWLRDLKGSYLVKIGLMVEKWWELGVLIRSDASAEALAIGLPAHAWIETGRPYSRAVDPKVKLLAQVEALDHPQSLQIAALAEQPPVYTPPRRRLRRDEI